MYSLVFEEMSSLLDESVMVMLAVADSLKIELDPT